MDDSEQSKVKSLLKNKPDPHYSAKKATEAMRSIKKQKLKNLEKNLKKPAKPSIKKQRVNKARKLWWASRTAEEKKEFLAKKGVITDRCIVCGIDTDPQTRPLKDFCSSECHLKSVQKKTVKKTVRTAPLDFFWTKAGGKVKKQVLDSVKNKCQLCQAYTEQVFHKQKTTNHQAKFDLENIWALCKDCKKLHP